MSPPVVNFIIIPSASFVYESVLRRFSLFTFCLGDFLTQKCWGKSALKMLLKLTPVVNFINILRARFLYKSYILAAFLVTFWLWRQNFVQKNAQNVDEIDS